MKPVLRSALLGTALVAAGLTLDIATLPAHAGPATTASDTDSRIDAILEHLGKARHFRGVAISPDGKQLAWTLQTADGSRVQLADADGGHVRGISLKGTFKGCHQGAPSWSPDGTRLAFLSNCGDADNKAQDEVYTVDTTAGKPQARQLGELDGYVHALSWAPDGKQLGILYVAGDTHMIGAAAAGKPRVGVIGENGVERQRMAVLDADNGTLRQVTPTSLFVYEYTWSPDSRQLAYVAAPPPGANNWWKARLYVQATDAAKPRQLVDAWTAKGDLHQLQMALPRFSPDGQSIAFIGGLMSDQGVTGGDIYRVPVAGGEAVNITPDIQITPSWFRWADDTHLLVSSIAGAQSQLAVFTLDGNKPATTHELFTLPAAFSDGTAVSALSFSDDHTHFAFIHSSFADAPEIHAGTLRLDGDGVPTGTEQTAHAVTSVNADIKPMWGKAEPINWHNEGHDVSGWLLFPADYDPSKRYPMIVSVHGGPVWAVRPGWPGVGYGPAPLSALGYFVFMPNPRGSMGQGEAFTKLVRGDMGYGDLRDILAGVDAVEKQYPVDDDRLGLTGWSYGGFMSMFVPTQTDRFHAVVAGAGISNWQSYYGQNSIDQWMLPFFGASVYDDPDAYAKSSAINYIKKAKAPTLIIAGEFDKECPAPQSFEQWHALRAMGVPTELVVYAGEGHHFMKPEHNRDVLERALGWFQKYLDDDTARP